MSAPSIVPFFTWWPYNRSKLRGLAMDGGQVLDCVMDPQTNEVKRCKAITPGKAFLAIGSASEDAETQSERTSELGSFVSKYSMKCPKEFVKAITQMKRGRMEIERRLAQLNPA